MDTVRFRIVFASFNEGKRREVAAILEGLPVQLLDPREVGVVALPDEDEPTFLGNAILKASCVFTATGLPVLADDSGLEVPALGWAPGVHSARYCGREHDDANNIAKLLKEIEKVEDRRGRFVCYAVLLDREGGLAAQSGLANRGEGLIFLRSHPLMPEYAQAIVAVGEVWGTIISEPRGKNGFGYDPIFYREDLGRTFAELSRDEKNRLSHRGQAFRAIRRYLEKSFEPL